MPKPANPNEMLLLLGRIFAGACIAIGTMVLIGWASKLEFLKNPFPDEVPAAISTAICLILSSSSILLISTGKNISAKVMAACSTAISLTILSHYLFRTFDLDQAFHGSSLPILGPDRMSPSILFCFLAVNIASMLNPKRYSAARDFLVLFASVLCLTAFAAHLYELPAFFHTRTIIQMASLTAVAGLLLSWSLLLLHPETGMVASLASPCLGGKFGRQYILPVIILPFVAGRLALNGVLNDYYDNSLGTALVVIFTVTCLVSMLFRVASWLNEADKERDKAQEEMRDNIENTRLIVDAATDAFMMIDAEGKIVDWNPAAEQMLGWTRTEALGKSFEFTLARADRKQHLENLSRYMSTGYSEHLNHMMELRLQRKDGTEFTAEGAPFAVRAGETERLGAFVHDISGRKESERRINEFISTVSHELRTPLTSIKGALRLIEGGLAGDVSGEAMSLINVASSETERLIRIVNDILDLKKIEAGKLELKCEEVAIDTLVEEALEGIGGMSTEYGIELSHEISISGFVYCDKDRIIQVLHNLLSNAIKFSPEGETVCLVIEQNAPQTVRFQVIDKGCGIPENQVHKLFGRFQQLDSSDTRQQGGTGLGLAISKAIVEEHQGSIGFESNYREGSTFWFELPLVLHKDASQLRETMEMERNLDKTDQLERI